MDAKAEDNDRYFWHVREVDLIQRGDKYFVIGRKGPGKTAISEYFLFNESHARTNTRYTAPNQFITIWKYLNNEAHAVTEDICFASQSDSSVSYASRQS